MTETPAPLVPADVDLRDFAFMPLDVVRLRDSDLAGVASAEEFRCAVLLWCASWHQVPAASLPDNDATLAGLAGFGRSVKEWRKHKTGAMRGWTKCDDGRLYHPVVAEKAVEAWNKRRTASAKGKAGAMAKWGNNHQKDTAQASPAHSPGSGTSIRQPLPKNGNRQGQGEGQKQESNERPRSGQETARESPHTLLDRLIEAAGSNVVHGAYGIEVVQPITDLQAVDCDLEEDILPAIREVVQKLDKPLRTWGAGFLRDAILSRQASRRRNRGTNGSHVSAAIDTPEQRDARDRAKIEYWNRHHKWIFEGPDPDSPLCGIPKEKIEEWSRPQS
jgi:Protein of unknown function (DUF1376)